MNKDNIILIWLILFVTIIFIPFTKLEHKKNISTGSQITNEEKIQKIYLMISDLEVDSYQKLQEKGRLLLEVKSLSGVIQYNDAQVSMLVEKIHAIKYSGVAK